ncbi:MAG: peptidoglycan-associated lipoprotein [Gammaproteobacteria bacterium]|mgnify:CR=1 FL=1|nr:peptidoglycan-associated lipoprotein [Gammaproteobacteria bacterium]|tara:strand:+ start:5028 stop:5501 length:474 start_codon:yes stop_codon:yes gene_type:complete
MTWFSVVLFFTLVICSASGCSIGPVLETTNAEKEISSVSADSYQESNIELSSLVYFSYDKYDLNPEALSESKNIAAKMKSNLSLKIRIEGHCDERGTREYNLALGEKRANAVAEILALNGISSNRIFTVSYGEEKPISAGSNESSWSKNRRAVLKVF